MPARKGPPATPPGLSEEIIRTASASPEEVLRKLRTVRRQAGRTRRPPGMLTLVLFEWPAGAPKGAVEFDATYAGETLPWSGVAVGGSAVEAGSAYRADIGWAYAYEVRGAAAAGPRTRAWLEVFAAAEGVLPCGWAALVAERTPPESARRFVWGPWAAQSQAAGEGSRSGGGPNPLRMRRVFSPRAEAVPQGVVIADFALASLLVLDELIAAAERVHAQLGLPTSAGGHGEASQKHGPRTPSQDEWRAWALWALFGRTQEQAAEELTRETGRQWLQPKVHRAVRVVEAYRGAGGQPPAGLEDGGAVQSRRVRTLKPRVLDLGSPTAHRTRSRPAEEDAAEEDTAGNA